MQFSTLLLISICSVLTVSAAPAESDKRACTTSWSAARGKWVLERTATRVPSFDIDFASIPVDAIGPCTLVVSFPRGKGTDFSGDVRANVYERLVARNYDLGSLAGTVELSGSNEQDTYKVINSFTCKPIMAYNFRLEGGEGRVAFDQEEESGITMTYGC